MANRPIIGVLAGRRAGESLPVYCATGHYIEQLDAAGAAPVLLPLSAELGPEQLAAWVRLCDGVLLPGGGDFPAELYGEEPLPGFDVERTPYNLRRQTLEIDFVRLAAAAGKPILGICRGEQAINVAFGGSLYQDVPTQFGVRLGHFQDPAQRTAATHAVATAPGSLLRRLTGADALWVNTYHHQAIKAVAPGFAVSATAPDGLIEAIECPEKRILGVQWHPENLASRPDEPGAAPTPEAAQSRALFRWLVEQARG